MRKAVFLLLAVVGGLLIWFDFDASGSGHEAEPELESEALGTEGALEPSDPAAAIEPAASTDRRRTSDESPATGAPESLIVRVVDRTGSAASGVHLAAWSVLPNGRVHRYAGLALGESTVSGELRVALRRLSAFASERKVAAELLRIGVDEPGCERVLSSVELEAGAEIQLELPPVGSILLKGLGSLEASESLGLSVKGRGHQVRRPWPSNGELLYQHVAIGADYVLFLAEVQERLRGPERPGEQVVLDFATRPTGTIALRVVDQGGVPVDPAELGFHLGAEQPEWRYRTSEPVLRDGAAVFEKVPVGLSFRLRAYEKAVAGRSCTLHFPGPAVHGERVEKTGRFELAPMLVAFVEWPDGSPYSGLLSAVAGTGSISRSISGLRCREGRLSFGLGEKAAGQTLDYARFEAARGLELWRVRYSGPLPLNQPRVDLGRIRLRESPALLSGRVELDGEFRRRPMLTLYVQERRGARTRWKYVRTQSVWDEQVCFALHGEAAAGPVQLRVEGVGGEYLPIDPIRATLGQGDIVLWLRPAASCRASVLLPQGSSAQSLLFQLVSEEHPLDESGDGLDRRSLARVQVSGATAGAPIPLSWTGLVPGKHRFELRQAWGGPVLLRIPGITLKPGGQRPEPLQGIDLREQVQRIRLSFELAGRPVTAAESKAWVLVRGAPGQRQQLVPIGVDGVAHVLSSHGRPLSILPLVPGAECRWVEGIVQDRVIRLRPALELLVKLADGVRVPPGYVVRVMLHRRDAGAHFPGRSGSYFAGSQRVYLRDQSPTERRVDLGESGRAQVLLPSPGSYEIDCWLKQQGKRSRDERLGEPRTMPLRRSSGPLVLDLSQAQLDAAKVRMESR